MGRLGYTVQIGGEKEQRGKKPLGNLVSDSSKLHSCTLRGCQWSFRGVLFEEGCFYGEGPSQ